MRYTIPFNLRGKENRISIDYQKIPTPQESGFVALQLPFDVNECVGYPMLHAYFENMNLRGYERYCGWIQVIERRDYVDINAKEPTTISFELDILEEMRKRKNPYFAYGYPAELFDAPCKNLGNSEKLDWRAYTYSVDLPSRMNNNQLAFWQDFLGDIPKTKMETFNCWISQSYQRIIGWSIKNMLYLWRKIYPDLWDTVVK